MSIIENEQTLIEKARENPSPEYLQKLREERQRIKQILEDQHRTRFLYQNKGAEKLNKRLEESIRQNEEYVEIIKNTIRQLSQIL